MARDETPDDQAVTSAASTIAPLEQRARSRGRRVQGESELLDRIQSDARFCDERGLWSATQSDLIPKWQRQLTNEPRRFIRDNGTIDEEALRDFRRLQIFVPDTPAWDPQTLDLRSLFGGGRRGDRRMLKEALAIVRSSASEPLLRKYPSPPIGDPYVFTDDGYVYTYRWLKHIWSLGLVREVLSARLPQRFVALDVGSSYGIFSGLVKHEWPTSHHVLVDFPEQLLLAHYFLGRWHPGCRIAGMAEVAGQAKLTREWLTQFDFVLVPVSCFGALAAGSADLVSNCASFGEMSRTCFKTYIDSDPVTTARYLFLVNRIQSAPTYDTDLTILDYPLWGPFRKLHFGIAPVFSNPYAYPRKSVLFSGKVANNPYFEYIGERSDA